MGRSLYLLSFFLLLALASAGDPIPDDDDAAPAAGAESKVITVTKDNLDGLLAENKHFLVAFVAPWCGHCKSLKPEFQQAAAQQDEFKLGQVDATLETELAQKHGVSGYPTIKFFSNGVASEYDGPRKADGIIGWLKENTGPAVVELASVDDVLKTTASSKPDIILEGPELLPAFEEKASAGRKNARWVFVKGSGSGITLKHKGEEAIKFASVEAIDDNAVDFPLFVKLDGESYGKITKSGKDVLWILLHHATPEEYETKVEEVRADYTKLAVEKKEKVLVTHTDTIQFKDAISSMFGVTTFPGAVYQPSGSKKKFVLKETTDMSSGAISAWITKIQAGEITPDLKSAEPVDDSKDNVKTFVGKNLAERAFDKERDVFLKIYAPWCGHCKTLAPEYEIVGEKIAYESIEDLLVVAKFDATENDSPTDKIEFSGFPSLFYIKAGTETPVSYDGERGAKGIWKYIKDNHSKSEELKKRIKVNKEARKAKAEAEAAAAGGEAKAEGKAEM